MNPTETKEMVIAAKSLVTAAFDQITENFRGYDRFGRTFVRLLGNVNGAGIPIELSTIEPLYEKHGSGLFVRAYVVKEDGEDGENLEQLISLQTATHPDSVDAEEARWLSSFSSDQLLMLARIIEDADPI